jgi:hypothetical protein
MAKYRKKPVVIDAFRFGYDFSPDWWIDANKKRVATICKDDDSSLMFARINTLEGWHRANLGDYIIRGVKGELYPCKADIFEMTYEEVQET